MDSVEVLGMAAGIISSITFLPQVIKTWQTKSAKGVSGLMFTFATISVIMWLIYGILIDKVSIIFTNATILLLSLTMLYFKIRYKEGS
jgi:MtN3 and saliva related transmembrane protein